MRGPVKKILLLIVLWSGFGFALNQYLEQHPKESSSSSAFDASSSALAPIAQNEETTENPQTVLSDESELKTESETGTSAELPIESPQQSSVSEQSSTAVENKPSQLSAAESNSFLSLGPETLDIVRNTPEIRWENNWEAIVDQLAYNMSIKPELTLEIIGYFDASEPIADPNLGIQRSVRVKNKLVAAGLNSERISCRGDLQRLFNASSPMPSLVIRVSEPLEERSGTKQTESQITEQSNLPNQNNINRNSQQNNSVPERANPILPKFNSVVYQPTFSDQGIMVDTNLMNLIPGIRQWLALDTKNYLEVWGHTDHVGHDQDNYRLALKWAGQARTFFIEKGIDPNRIKAFSAGEQQPLYTNNNLRGRQRNRRIELIFKF